MAKTPKTATQREVAEAAGVGVNTVVRAMDNGLIPESWLRRTPSGNRRILFERMGDAISALAASGRHAKADDELTPRAQRDFYEARLAEVKLQRELKELIPTAEVERQVTGAFSKLATRLLQMPAQLAAELHAAESVHAVEALLEASIRERFADFRAEVCGMVMQSGLDDGDPNGSETPFDSTLN